MSPTGSSHLSGRLSSSTVPEGVVASSSSQEESSGTDPPGLGLDVGGASKRTKNLSTKPDTKNRKMNGQDEEHNPFSSGMSLMGAAAVPGATTTSTYTYDLFGGGASSSGGGGGVTSMNMMKDSDTPSLLFPPASGVGSGSSAINGQTSATTSRGKWFPRPVPVRGSSDGSSHTSHLMLLSSQHLGGGGAGTVDRASPSSGSTSARHPQPASSSSKRVVKASRSVHSFIQGSPGDEPSMRRDGSRATLFHENDKNGNASSSTKVKNKQDHSKMLTTTRRESTNKDPRRANTSRRRRNDQTQTQSTSSRYADHKHRDDDDALLATRLSGSGAKPPNSEDYMNFESDDAATAENEEDELLRSVDVGKSRRSKSNSTKMTSSRHDVVCSGCPVSDHSRAGDGNGIMNNYSTASAVRGGARGDKLLPSPSDGSGQAVRHVNGVADRREADQDSNICRSCGVGIPTGVPFVIEGLSGDRYHEECFLCVDCGKQVDSEEYKPTEDGPQCLECALPQCHQCRNLILGTVCVARTPEGVDLKFHTQCLRCIKCGHSIQHKYKAGEDGFLCRSCANPHCDRCKKIIDGGSQYYLNSTTKAPICGECHVPATGSRGTVSCAHYAVVAPPESFVMRPVVEEVSTSTTEIRGQEYDYLQSSRRGGSREQHQQLTTSKSSIRNHGPLGTAGGTATQMPASSTTNFHRPRNLGAGGGATTTLPESQPPFLRSSPRLHDREIHQEQEQNQPAPYTSTSSSSTTRRVEVCPQQRPILSTTHFDRREAIPSSYFQDIEREHAENDHNLAPSSATAHMTTFSSRAVPDRAPIVQRTYVVERDPALPRKNYNTPDALSSSSVRYDTTSGMNVQRERPRLASSDRIAVEEGYTRGYNDPRPTPVSGFHQSPTYTTSARREAAPVTHGGGTTHVTVEERAIPIGSGAHSATTRMNLADALRPNYEAVEPQHMVTETRRPVAPPPSDAFSRSVTTTTTTRPLATGGGGFHSTRRHVEERPQSAQSERIEVRSLPRSTQQVVHESGVDQITTVAPQHAVKEEVTRMLPQRTQSFEVSQPSVAAAPHALHVNSYHDHEPQRDERPQTYQSTTFTSGPTLAPRPRQEHREVMSTTTRTATRPLPRTPGWSSGSYNSTSSKERLPQTAAVPQRPPVFHSATGPAPPTNGFRSEYLTEEQPLRGARGPPASAPPRLVVTTREDERSQAAAPSFRCGPSAATLHQHSHSFVPSREATVPVSSEQTRTKGLGPRRYPPEYGAQHSGRDAMSSGEPHHPPQTVYEETTVTTTAQPQPPVAREAPVPRMNGGTFESDSRAVPPPEHLRSHRRYPRLPATNFASEIPPEEDVAAAPPVQPPYPTDRYATEEVVTTTRTLPSPLHPHHQHSYVGGYRASPLQAVPPHASSSSHHAAYQPSHQQHYEPPQYARAGPAEPRYPHTSGHWLQSSAQWENDRAPPHTVEHHTTSIGPYHYDHGEAEPPAEGTPRVHPQYHPGAGPPPHDYNVTSSTFKSTADRERGGPSRVGLGPTPSPTYDQHHESRVFSEHHHQQLPPADHINGGVTFFAPDGRLFQEVDPNSVHPDEIAQHMAAMNGAPGEHHGDYEHQFASSSRSRGRKKRRKSKSSYRGGASSGRTHRTRSLSPRRRTSRTARSRFDDESDITGSSGDEEDLLENEYYNNRGPRPREGVLGGEPPSGSSYRSEFTFGGGSRDVDSHRGDSGARSRGRSKGSNRSRDRGKPTSSKRHFEDYDEGFDEEEMNEAEADNAADGGRGRHRLADAEEHRTAFRSGQQGFGSSNSSSRKALSSRSTTASRQRAPATGQFSSRSRRGSPEISDEDDRAGSGADDAENSAGGNQGKDMHGSARLRSGSTRRRHRRHSSRGGARGEEQGSSTKQDQEEQQDDVTQTPSPQPRSKAPLRRGSTKGVLEKRGHSPTGTEEATSSASVFATNVLTRPARRLIGPFIGPPPPGAKIVPAF
ncbi:unnamed protein product [Amoebophrya sp. A25]|nr:unnamed protein product [Amoebophrya sp. A25]|eukprot:GSA25T00025128001.1